MITREELNSITCLNTLVQNTEYYRAAVSTDPTIRNTTNIYKCIKMQELYGYLYKHYEMLKDVFNTEEDGTFNTYIAHSVLAELHSYMCNQNASAAQALKELKRIKSAVDYKADETRNKLNNQKSNLLKQEYDKKEKRAIIDNCINKLVEELGCKKYKDPNTKAILLIRQAYGESTIGVINIIETDDTINAVLTKTKTGERFYIRQDTIHNIVEHLKYGR